MCSEFHPFKVYGLMNFNKCVYLYNHLHSQDTISTISIAPKSSQKFLSPLAACPLSFTPGPSKDRTSSDP